RTGKKVGMVQPLMFNRVAERACDRFLACYLVEGLRAPLSGDNLIGHWCRCICGVFGLALSRREDWPDPGLSRNTRCRCYRCSVPGLAGFTRLALCGARSLITHCRLPGFDLQPELNGRLTVRDYSQQAVDSQMQQHINDDRDYQ